MPYVASFPFRALRPESSRDPWWLISDTQVIVHVPCIIILKSCAEETLAAKEAQLKDAEAEIQKRVLCDESIQKQLEEAEASRTEPRSQPTPAQQLAYEKGLTDERRRWLLYFRARQIAISDVAVVPPP